MKFLHPKNRRPRAGADSRKKPETQNAPGTPETENTAGTGGPSAGQPDADRSPEDPDFPPEADLDWSGLREPVGDTAPRRRFPLWAVGCAAVMVLGALAPAAMFAIADTTLFSSREQTDGGYQSLTPKGSDYYLVRMLHERRDANYESSLSDGSGQGGFYYQTYASTGSLPLDYNLAPKVEQVMDEYVGLGILDSSWVDGFYQDLAADGLTLDYNLSGSSDTLGFLSIACDAGDVRRLGITMEAHTGKVVELYIRTTWPGLAEFSDAREILNQWIALNDLEDLGDWAVPTGTCWEDFGLYSARGELMAICWLSETENGSVFWLELQPCTAEMLAAGTFAPSAEDSAITSEMLDRETLKQPAQWDRKVYSDGDTGYYIRDLDDGSGQVRYLDYTANTDGCVCQKPGCTHDNADCPAWLSREEMAYSPPALFAAEGCVYLAFSGNQGIDTEDQAVGVLMENGWEVTEESIRDLLRVGVERISADGLTRETVADLPEAASDWTCVAVDGTKAWFTRSLAYWESEEPADNYLVCDVTTGQITQSPARFFRYEEVLGCYGGCLLIRRTVDPMDILHYWSSALGSAGETTSLSCYELVDPATGERRAVSTGNYFELYPQWSVLFSARDKLVTVGVATDGICRVNMVDLRTGEMEETDLPDLLIERVLGDDANLGYHIAPDCGLPWVQLWYDDTVIYYDPTTGEVRQSVLEGPCVVQALTGDGRVVAENLGITDRSGYLAGPPEDLWQSAPAFAPLLWADDPQA